VRYVFDVFVRVAIALSSGEVFCGGGGGGRRGEGGYSDG